MDETIRKILESFIFEGLEKEIKAELKKGSYSKRFWLDLFKDGASDEMSTPLIMSQLTGGNVIRDVLLKTQKESKIFRDWDEDTIEYMRKTCKEWLTNNIFDCPEEFYSYYPEYVDWFEVLIYHRHFEDEATNRIFTQHVTTLLNKILADSTKISHYDLSLGQLFWLIIDRGIHVPAKLLNQMYSKGKIDLFLDEENFSSYVNEYLASGIIDIDSIKIVNNPNRITEYFAEFHQLNDELKLLIATQCM